jgi:hypothetical protein
MKTPLRFASVARMSSGVNWAGVDARLVRALGTPDIACGALDNALCTLPADAPVACATAAA